MEEIFKECRRQDIVKMCCVDIKIPLPEISSYGYKENLIKKIVIIDMVATDIVRHIENLIAAQ